MRKGLLIKLIDPLITSASPATAATPEALPNIPGAMLLGVAATRGYADGLMLEKAFTLFHSGTVRFDDGLPMCEAGRVGLPNPLSLHFPKGKYPFKNLIDFADVGMRPGHEQLRGKAMSGGAEPVDVKTSTTMRTAIDRSTGRAAGSQLFGYQMLDAGQFFMAGIEAPDQGLLDEAIACLFGGDNTETEVFLGRSKSGEFGRVKITLCAPLELPNQMDASSPAYLWCLSDLWAYDQNGLPTLSPDAAFFESCGSIDWTRSFTRTRNFSPYNAQWRTRGLERALISRGSVFVVGSSNLKPGIHRFGLGQELGYGLVLISSTPPLVTLMELAAKNVDLPQAEAAQDTGISDLVTWLKQVAPRADLDVSQDLEALAAHFKTAKRIAGYAVGPGPNQWGSLKSKLQRGEETAAFLGGTRANIEREQWGAQYAVDAENTFKAYVESVIEKNGTDYAARLAKEIRIWLEKERWFDGK